MHGYFFHDFIKILKIIKTSIQVKIIQRKPNIFRFGILRILEDKDRICQKIMINPLKI
jgi:hypothetical protein